MTRAEEALFIGGALGKREKEPAADSWYARLAPLFGADDALDDPIWGARLRAWASARRRRRRAHAGRAAAADAVLPDWADAPDRPPSRARRARSRLVGGRGRGRRSAAAARVAARRGAARGADPPPARTPARRAADDARGRGAAWLARQRGRARPRRARATCWRARWRCSPIPHWARAVRARRAGRSAARRDGRRAGHRGHRSTGCWSSRTRIRVVDFKTARRPPAALDEVPAGDAAADGRLCRGARRRSIPGRAIEAAVLYTQTPRLIAIPAELLAAHKRGFVARAGKLCRRQPLH